MFRLCCRCLSMSYKMPEFFGNSPLSVAEKHPDEINVSITGDIDTSILLTEDTVWRPRASSIFLLQLTGFLNLTTVQGDLRPERSESAALSQAAGSL